MDGIEKELSSAGWLIVREIAISIQNRLRSYKGDFKRIAEWEPGEKRTRRLEEVGHRIETLEWVVGEINKRKESHGFDRLMKEKVRSDAAKANYPEQELTEEELAEGIARAQAAWTPEERESRIVGPRHTAVDIRVCKVLGGFGGKVE